MERRQQILSAAEGLLVAQGVRKTTVAEIARAACIGVGSVYLEFGSKDDIILELSSRYFDGILRAMRRATMTEGGYQQRLRAMLYARHEAMLAAGRGGQAAAELVDCAGCQAVAQARARFERAQRELFVDLMELACEAGEFAGEPAALCEGVLLATEGLCPPALYRLSAQEAQRRLERLVDVLLTGLLRR